MAFNVDHGVNAMSDISSNNGGHLYGHGIVEHNSYYYGENVEYELTMEVKNHFKIPNITYRGNEIDWGTTAAVDTLQHVFLPVPYFVDKWEHPAYTSETYLTHILNNITPPMTETRMCSLGFGFNPATVLFQYEHLLKLSGKECSEILGLLTYVCADESEKMDFLLADVLRTFTKYNRMAPLIALALYGGDPSLVFVCVALVAFHHVRSFAETIASIEPKVSEAVHVILNSIVDCMVEKEEYDNTHGRVTEKLVTYRCIHKIYERYVNIEQRTCRSVYQIFCRFFPFLSPRKVPVYVRHFAVIQTHGRVDACHNNPWLNLFMCYLKCKDVKLIAMIAHILKNMYHHTNWAKTELPHVNMAELVHIINLTMHDVPIESFSISKRDSVISRKELNQYALKFNVWSAVLPFTRYALLTQNKLLETLPAYEMYCSPEDTVRVITPHQWMIWRTLNIVLRRSIHFISEVIVKSVPESLFTGATNTTTSTSSHHQ